MTEMMLHRLNKRSESEIASIVKELEGALHQIKYQQGLMATVVSAEDKAECLDAINRQIRMMKSHINETALAYMAGLYDADSEDAA